MKRPQEITSKLKKCDLELKLYVEEIEKINLKLHKQIAKLQAQNVNYKNEITALKKQPPLKVTVQKFSDNHIKELTDEQLEKN